MATPLYSPKRVQDLFIEEQSQRQTRDEFTFANNTGSTASFEVGQTLIASGANKVIAPAGDCDSVLLTPITNLANAGTVKVAVLSRGPCVINQDALVFAAGVDSTEAGTQRADLLALGIVCRREPLKQGGVDDVLT